MIWGGFRGAGRPDGTRAGSAEPRRPSGRSRSVAAAQLPPPAAAFPGRADGGREASCAGPLAAAPRSLPGGTGGAPVRRGWLSSRAPRPPLPGLPGRLGKGEPAW